MNADDKLAQAVSDWQRKYRIAGEDPMMAALELVRIYLHEVRRIDNDSDSAPPSFEDFRGTIELLDRRSKGFVQQATDLAGELRRFEQDVKRLSRERFIVILIIAVQSALAGALISRML